VSKRLETVSRLDDARRAAVEALIRAATLADGVPPVGEHKYLKLHDGVGPVWGILAYDSDGVGGRDRLVGYAQVLGSGATATAEIVVHPAERGHGIGRRLVEAARERAALEGARELKLWAYGALPATAAIAARHGLVATRTLLQLERPLDDLPPAPALDGYVVRAFDPARDCEPWLALHNAVFADHPENGRWSSDDVDARLRQPWFRAEDFLVAEAATSAGDAAGPDGATAGGRMVGFNWLKRVPDAPPERPEGEIYIIGVSGTERGRGLGRALALLGLHHLRREGMKVCTLYVEGDNGPALGLYGALGFTVRHTHRCYTVPLIDAATAHAAHPATTLPATKPALVYP
jgi:mycothiol synthase